LLASTSQYGQVNGDIIGVTRTDTIQLGNEVSPEGKIKYEANDFFGHDGTTWKSLTQASGGGASNALEDDDGDTKIELINGVGTDDDTLRISIDGVTTAEYVRNSFGDYRMNIKDTLLNGNLFIGNNAGSQNGDANPLTTFESKNNTAIGHFALDKNDKGYNNTAVGQGALNNNTEGFNNTAVGQGVLGANTTGDNNSAFGYNALNSNSVGNNNTAFGFSAMLSNTSGTGNTAYGTETLKEVTTGNNNSAFGDNALKLGRGGFNTAIGASALSSDTTGIHNTAIGYLAMSNSKGPDNSNNTAIGSKALVNNKSFQNTAIGSHALRKNDSGIGNIAVGFLSLSENDSGYNNAALGKNALQYNKSGYHNVAIGSASMSGQMMTNPTGYHNIAIGSNSMSKFLDATNNVAIGSHALQQNEIKSHNVAIGYHSLRGSTTTTPTGENNVAIGAHSLENYTTGSSNVAIGYKAGQSAAGSNQLIIANSDDGSFDKSEPLIYGEFDNEFLQVNDSLEVTGNITEEGFSVSRYRGSGTAAPNTILNPESGDIYLEIFACQSGNEGYLHMYADTSWFSIGYKSLGCTALQSEEETDNARVVNDNTIAQTNITHTQSTRSSINSDKRDSKSYENSNITQVMSLKEQAQAPDAPKLGDIYLHDNGKGASPQYEMRIYSGNTWEIIKAF